jgi:hypothetical protein
MKTFEQYLEERHAEGYTGTDDDMVDSFDEWISCLDAREAMIYAEGWMNEYRSFIRQTIHEVTK